MIRHKLAYGPMTSPYFVLFNLAPNDCGGSAISNAKLFPERKGVDV